MTTTMTAPTAPDVRAGRPAMANGTGAAFGYVHGLDALRLFAVTIVVVRHYELLMMLPGGFGVSVFFFISGFLISRLLLAEEKRYGTIFLGKFYVRRFIRLLPPLMLMGVVAVPLLYLTDPARFSPVQLWLSFLYLGNIVRFLEPVFNWNIGYPAIEPLWSLAVEEHFYLVLPPMLLLIRSMRGRIWLITGAIILPLMLRLVAYATMDEHMADQFNYHFTFTRLDSMAWGVLLTLLLDAGKLKQATIDRVPHWLVWGGGIGMILSMVHWSPMYEVAVKYTPQSAVIGVFFTGVIFATQYDWLRRAMEWKPIVHLGRITYEIYLWHFPVLAVVLAFVPNRSLAVAISGVVTVAIADLAFRVTTKRLSGLRKRFGAHPVA